MAATSHAPPPAQSAFGQRPPGGGGSSLWAELRAPGYYRAAALMLVAVLFSAFLTWIVRLSTGHSTYRHYISPDAILTVSLLAAPLLFLVGIGGFDYWFHWAIGG